MKPWMYPQLDQMGIPIIMIERYAFQIAKVLITRNQIKEISDNETGI